MEAEEEKSVDTVKEDSPKKEESVKSDSSEALADNKNSSQENEDTINEQDEEPQCKDFILIS